jgi:FKBP-type peptidyl-prolyl cis-trans isomerase
MKPGDKMTVECPAKLAYGQTKNVYSDFSSEVIPVNSDLTYEIEVLSCLNHQSWAS